MQMKKLEVADAGLPRAMEMVPSLCCRPVCFVVSRKMGANSFTESTSPPCITSIFTESFGWLFKVTALKKLELSYKWTSTYFKKLATVTGAFEGYSSTVILPSCVLIKQEIFFCAGEVVVQIKKSSVKKDLYILLM